MFEGLEEHLRREKAVEKKINSTKGLEKKIEEKVLQKLVWKRELLFEQKGQCCFCETRMHLFYNKNKQNMTTLEHVLPKSLGGSCEKENFKVSCYPCNNKRETKDFAEFENLAKEKTFVEEKIFYVEKRTKRSKFRKNFDNLSLFEKLKYLFKRHYYQFSLGKSILFTDSFKIENYILEEINC